MKIELELEELIDLINSQKFNTIRFSTPYVKPYVPEKIMGRSGTQLNNSVTTDINSCTAENAYKSVPTDTVGVYNNNTYNTAEHNIYHNNSSDSDSKLKTHTPEEISYWVNFGRFPDKEGQ